ncbi:type II secretion system protein [Gordonibacter sp. An230]|uniref:type II secretion system F family protein n=1 Tax=Gordonibacter sp. An230 TaxID=1965592 RepID=UPI000B3A3E63|nr:type II secretion system F family protein [Gordonibacter sp. An230]OUO92131.1 type II secretion system protein [Gordonibacter sp. An230]
MEARMLLGGVTALGALAAFGCGALAASAALQGARRASGRMRGSGTARAGWLARKLRDGVSCTRPLARLLMRSTRCAKVARGAVREARERGVPASEVSLVSAFLASAFLVALVTGLALASPVGGVAAAVCLCAVVTARLKKFEERRRDAMRDAVPEALRSMGVCFRSGFSLLQTLQQVAGEAPEPLGALFGRAAHRLQAGQGASEALDALREGATVPELSFVAVALNVQHEAGGSLSQVLEAARESVEGEIELNRSLRVQTAQAKLSARIVSVMPFVLIAVFSLVSEGFLEPFFSSAAGFALLALALGMQAAGVLAVRRMLAAEVG